jgi:hypothetical protein
VSKKTKKYPPLELSEVLLYDQYYQEMEVDKQDGSFTRKKK